MGRVRSGMGRGAWDWDRVFGGGVVRVEYWDGRI